MTLPPGHLVRFLTLSLLSGYTAGINTTPQTLAASNVYGQLEPCAQGCFYRWAGYCSYDQIAGVLGCAADCLTWAANDCYCRTDYQSIATAYIWTCVSKGCTRGDNNRDITSATNLYISYCGNLGYPPPTQAPITAQPPTVPASSPTTVGSLSATTGTLPSTTTTDAVSTNSSRESISISTSANASTTLAGNSGGSGGGTGNIGTILGSVFGGLAVVVALLAWLLPRKVIVERGRAVLRGFQSCLPRVPN